MGKRKRRSEKLVSEASSVLDSASIDSDPLERRARKVRRRNVAQDTARATTHLEDDTDASDDEADPARQQREISHVKPGMLAFPRSAYEGYESSLPVSSEVEALGDFKPILRRQRAEASEPPEHDFIVLESFSAYRDPRDARRPNELAGLEKLQVHRGTKDGFLFDGVLRLGDERRYVQGVPFRIITVEGYGDEAVTDLTDRICIQSSLGKRLDIWYQLGRPSREYERFYEPFLWLAEFAKHFVDYLLEMESVTLEDFRFCFYDWLTARHENDQHLRRWLGTCKLRDFRTTVAAHVPYLRNECWGVETKESGLLAHPIWGEVDPYNLQAITEQPNREQKTVVTPFVYDMFKHMYFRKHLDERDITSDPVLGNIHAAKSDLGLAPFGLDRSNNTALLTPKTQRSVSPATILSISVGDVVCLDADREGEWKSNSSTWYAYVQGQRVNEQTQATILDVLWLYEAYDTTVGAAYYPYSNELFLSDNCECGRDAIEAGHVRKKIDVSWYAKNPNIESGFFVRQKFRTAHGEGTDDFVSLQPSDFKCRCKSNITDFEDCRLRYEIGDTVLVKAHHPMSHETVLVPALLVDFDLIANRIMLRKLQQRSDVDGSARPNELCLTDVVLTKSATQIIRKCHVRIFSREVIDGGLPVGYDRNGAGDLYYIEESSFNEFTAMEPTALPAITEGVDLVAPPAFSRLTGMGIFCGGGNFDRGLEESGAVDFKYAVDWAKRAMYTYRANSREPDKMHCFLGSVNDYLALAMEGSKDSFTALPGEISFISAGSPCPGFSSLQQDKASDASLRNASMVASVISFVDVFCPKYCILENVVNMTTAMGKEKDQNVFSQIIAAFVAMGYQVQQFLMDSWSFGSSQSRSRVFIVASAPGLEPFPLPRLTHDHPQSAIQLRALGKSSNGRSFGVRRDEYTPFQCVSAAEATADLPDIADGQSRICPSFPDHWMPSEEDADGRGRIAAVPTRPPGMSLADTVRKGLVSGEPKEFLEKSSMARQAQKSKSYSRVRPNFLFSAVTTGLRLACGFTGRTLHWSQNRSLTVMELRRAMGFHDHEVLIGSPRQQVHIVGNSVDRKVSFALGLCLRESWAKSNASLAEADIGVAAALASPLPTEDNATDQQSDQFGEPVMLFDILRAGASAQVQLETPERTAIRRLNPAQTTRGRSATNVIGLTSDGSDDEMDERQATGLKTDGTPEDAQEATKGRPTAYVEIRRDLYV